ncbi:MAG: hypothetical protein PVG14_07530 [Anaerolineales bacterium]|jgi:hypothetical protein
MTCLFTQGEYSIAMDMPEIMGGDETGPSPGFFARADLAGCVSMGIKQAPSPDHPGCHAYLRSLAVRGVGWQMPC